MLFAKLHKKYELQFQITISFLPIYHNVSVHVLNPQRRYLLKSSFLSNFVILNCNEPVMRIVINPRYQRLSYFINELPMKFDTSGETLYQGRNQVKAFQVQGYPIVVKRYKRPSFIQRVIYSWFRPTKACRAYNFAFRMQKLGIQTPEAIAYIEINRHGLFIDSYFVSLRCNDTPLFPILVNEPQYDKQLAHELAIYIVELRKKGFLHGDLNLANILYRQENGKPIFTFIDTNRSHFIKSPTPKVCLKNLMRITHRIDLLREIVQTYAEQRGWDAVKSCDQVEAMLHHFERKRAYKYQLKKIIKSTR